MKKRKINVLLRVIRSSKLALALVLLLILFAAAGAILPQESLFSAADISNWQEKHTILTGLFKPLGFFHVFFSFPFLVVILLLALNTLTCTLAHFIEEGGFPTLRGPGAIKRVGFTVLHLCLILLLGSSFYSTAFRMDGYIVLTEGQRLKEERRSYVRFARGPLCRENHLGFFLHLNKVQVEYKQLHYPVAVTSSIEIYEDRAKVAQADVKANHPFTYKGIDYTLDETGFSPRLLIRGKIGERLLIDSFIALKTFREGTSREYRDFLPLPFFKERITVTLYPAHTRENGRVRKSGEEPENPLLVVETEEKSGQVVHRQYIPIKGSAVVGDYTITFAGLRRWASFKVVSDPGYPIVILSLWLGIAAILLRYIPDLRAWFSRSAPL